jgi:hypothetical protein
MFITYVAFIGAFAPDYAQQQVAPLTEPCLRY